MRLSVRVGLDQSALHVTGKGAKERLVPFGEEAHRWLVRYLREARAAILDRKTSDALFVTALGRGMTRQRFYYMSPTTLMLALERHVELELEIDEPAEAADTDLVAVLGANILTFTSRPTAPSSRAPSRRPRSAAAAAASAPGPTCPRRPCGCFR